MANRSKPPTKTVANQKKSRSELSEEQKQEIKEAFDLFDTEGAGYIDAKEFLPHIPIDQYPGQALVCALYEEGGVRGVEIGSLMFGKYDEAGKLIPVQLELVRLAMPRRVYTQSHIDYVSEVIIDVFQRRKEISGLKIIEETLLLRHFTVALEPIN